MYDSQAIIELLNLIYLSTTSSTSSQPNEDMRRKPKP